jgi:hypothetical protein
MDKILIEDITIQSITILHSSVILSNSQLSITESSLQNITYLFQNENVYLLQVIDNSIVNLRNVNYTNSTVSFINMK